MFGIDDAVAAVAKLADDAISRIWPDATEAEKLKAQALSQEMQNVFSLQLGQLKINEVEAASTSMFVAGWRPAVGWVCGAGFAYEFLLRPLGNAIAVANGFPPIFPGVELDALSTLLFGLLGLAGARTVEKIQGVARHK